MLLKNIKQLFNLLSSSQRKNFLLLQILVIFMSFLEIIAIGCIIPFMAIVGDKTIIERETLLSTVYKISGITSDFGFIFFLGIITLSILIISTLTSTFTTWKLAMFANRVGLEISDRLFSYYLRQNWLYHTSTSSSELTKKIANETMRLNTSVIVPLIQMNARIVLALFITITFLIYDPIISLIGFLIFTSVYFIIYKGVRRRLEENGKAISNLIEKRFSLMNNAFGGIKDILFLGRSLYFEKKFEITSKNLANSLGNNNALTQAPRYVVELFAFGLIILLLLYLIALYQGNLGTILPIISVYALTGFKLLPAFQHIYVSIAKIKGNISAFETIKLDLINSKKIDFINQNNETSIILPKKQISLQNITFTYPNKNQPAIKELNMNIPVNQVVGIVGSSGAGKSTIIDILLGLIEPKSGVFKVDDTIINKHNLRAWQNSISYVPQNIFFSELSIAENIAFGIAFDEINFEKINKAIKLSQASEFVSSLEYKIETKIGERGVKLSGGQRQRIGIARALYEQSNLIIFDEATSSLDNLTEKKIMDAIYNLKGLKTVILIAHRIKTIEKCDKIFFLEKGKIVDSGSYQELLDSNKSFRAMSTNS